MQNDENIQQQYSKQKLNKKYDKEFLQYCSEPTTTISSLRTTCYNNYQQQQHKRKMNFSLPNNETAEHYLEKSVTYNGDIGYLTSEVATTSTNAKLTVNINGNDNSCIAPPSPAPQSDLYYPLNNLALPNNYMDACAAKKCQSPTAVSAKAYYERYNNYNEKHSINQKQQQGILSLCASTSTTSLAAVQQHCSNNNNHMSNNLLGSGRYLASAATNNERFFGDYIATGTTTPVVGALGNFSSSNMQRNLTKTATNIVGNSGTTFLTQQNYDFLKSSTAFVHTPIKRYVPSPPAVDEVITNGYADNNLTCNNNATATTVSNHHHHHQQSSQQHSDNVANKCHYNILHVSGMLSYHRIHVNCCNDLQQSQQQPNECMLSLQQQEQQQHNLYELRTIQQQQQQQQQQNIDFYGTSPRQRSTINHNKTPYSTLTTIVCNNAANNIAREHNDVQQDEQQQFSRYYYQQQQHQPQQKLALNYKKQNNLEHQQQLPYNSIPAITSTNNNDTIIDHGDTEIGSTSNNTAAIATTVGTCLHCNNVRRTAGVHQTTQTTGPVSPVQLVIPNKTSSNKNANNNSNQSQKIGTQAVSVAKSLEQQSLKPTITIINSPPVTAFHQEQHQLQQQQFKNKIIYNVTAQNQQREQQQIRYPQHEQPTPSQNQSQPSQQTQQATLIPPTHCTTTHKKKKQHLNDYMRTEIARFFGFVSDDNEAAAEISIWRERQRRFAMRRFGALKCDHHQHCHHRHQQQQTQQNAFNGMRTNCYSQNHQHHMHHQYNLDYIGDTCCSNNSNSNGEKNFASHAELPDILPASQDDDHQQQFQVNRSNNHNLSIASGQLIERRVSVITMLMSSITFLIQCWNQRPISNNIIMPRQRQSSRSFATIHIQQQQHIQSSYNGENDTVNGSVVPEECQGFLEAYALQEHEVFFDTLDTEQVLAKSATNNNSRNPAKSTSPTKFVNTVTTTTASINAARANNVCVENCTTDQASSAASTSAGYYGERMSQGWRRSVNVNNEQQANLQACNSKGRSRLNEHKILYSNANEQAQQQESDVTILRGTRIAPTLLDSILENSRRPLSWRVKLLHEHELDDSRDHRPFFTYWINTVQVLVLILSVICYGIGPIGLGVEQRTGQVLVTSLSLQTVQHMEQRNIWIGPRTKDLVHIGAKFTTCMRRDIKITDVLLKTRRQERETACCIRNDDSGCVQSSQADCSVRGLFPTKSIATWKKWSPAESGPGGRISGSVCGLDPKYCDVPASIAPYEWPDDITKWPICRKTNSFSQRFRYKDHTAEHMVCEVIGHPCCTGVLGECRITTREYCDFVAGYFHEEASLCSQISCLNNVCGMFPFISVEVPDQFYRLLTSLCLHAGILHLAITVTFQHIFLADLERLIGPIRTAILYIGSGLAGNLTSAVLVPYKPEVGPLGSLAGVLASFTVLLILIHWKQVHNPHMALFKLFVIAAFFFGIGTLPWQLNFTGLIAGIFCGVLITVALVPFVSISQYGQQAKINLIWFCIIIHLCFYILLLITFYLFPMELTSMKFGGVFGNSFNHQNISSYSTRTLDHEQLIVIDNHLHKYKIRGDRETMAMLDPYGLRTFQAENMNDHNDIV